MSVRHPIDVLMDAKAMDWLYFVPRSGFTQVCLDHFGESREQKDCSGAPDESCIDWGVGDAGKLADVDIFERPKCLS